MSNRVFILDSSHNEELLYLSSLCDTGSTWFRVDRSPNFFALSKCLGESTYFGVYQDDRLIGCIGVTQQARVIQDKVENVYYLHDLRVHPNHRGRGVFHQLINAVREEYQGKTTWMFGTIIDQNEHKRLLTRNKLQIPIKKVGKTIHIGLPLFWLRSGGNPEGIEAVSPEEAWENYVSFTSSLSFAPHHQRTFLSEPGVFLRKIIDGQVISVCKLVDQSYARRIIASRNLSLSLQGVNLISKLRRYPPLPNQGEAFQHAYLAYYASQPGIEDRKDYLHYISKMDDRTYTYLFMGLSKLEAAHYQHPLAFSFSSSTYVYGLVTKDFELDFHELTLI